jgi:Tfp pilus assembly protein FimV
MSVKNGSSGGPDLEALRAEIRQTRAELGETVSALAAKTDVKARAREELDHAKARAVAQLHETGDRVRRNPLPLVAVVGAGIALVGIILVVRRATQGGWR